MAIKAPFLKRIVLEATSGDSYPYTIPLVRKGFDLALTKPVTLICGENGSGKSTLIESIAHHCGFSLTGGNRNHAGASDDGNLSGLQGKLSFSWTIKVSGGFFVRAESFFQFANQIDRIAQEDGPAIYRAYGGESLHAQSHGEAFLSLFSHQLHRRGIFILDEPEAALSPQRQLALLKIITQLTSSGNAQVILATHSPLLMACPGAELFYINEGEISGRQLTGTPHFQVMARFFDDPEGYLARVLEG